jgi:hypothetical protein
LILTIGTKAIAASIQMSLSKQLVKVWLEPSSGMHIVAKITIGAGALTLLAGIVMLVLAGSSISDTGNWVAEETTGATLKIVDEDGAGDIGFAFFVKGEYTDDDGDGVWDHCSGVEITVKQKPAVADWYDEKGEKTTEEEGDFYFQASEDKGKSCDVEEGKDTNRPGFVKLGMACFGCYEGDLEFEANQPVWVVYVDEVLGDLFGAIFAGMGAGSCLCCGILFLIVGLIMSLTMKDSKQKDVTFQPVGQTEEDLIGQ